MTIYLCKKKEHISTIIRNFNICFIFSIEHAFFTSMHYGWV